MTHARGKAKDDQLQQSNGPKHVCLSSGKWSLPDVTEIPECVEEITAPADPEDDAKFARSSSWAVVGDAGQVLQCRALRGGHARCSAVSTVH